MHYTLQIKIKIAKLENFLKNYFICTFIYLVLYKVQCGGKKGDSVMVKQVTGYPMNLVFKQIKIIRYGFAFGKFWNVDV